MKAKAPLRVLAEVGGFELAAIAGLYLAAAKRGIPVILDGYLSAAAALTAVAIEPQAREWMLASHLSTELGHAVALRALELEPLLDLRMRLGEGTGAALSLQIIRGALALHREMATFAQAGVSGPA
jgi:nicotinate-nucleotide--dimethylbenzimidazole phosphoribosyltransferase